MAARAARIARLALALLLAAAPLAARAETVTVFAAASLRGALDEAARAFEARSPHRVRVAYAASSALARQVEAGAPAQVFLAADPEWMEYIASRGLVKGTPAILLTNSLVMVAPAGRAPGLAIAPGFAIEAALGKGRLAIADPRHVPAGRYARAALQSLGVWDRVAARIAPAEHVRAALALVARGEAPLGIVYRTDALAEPAVAIVGGFPAGTHPPIRYSIAVLQGAGQAADELVAFLRSPGARATWSRHGFGAP